MVKRWFAALSASLFMVILWGYDAYAAYPPEREKLPLLSADYISGNEEQDLQLARNIASWQMDHGGWYKFTDNRYYEPWDGVTPRSDIKLSDGTEVGIIDNNATVDQLLFVSLMYRESGDPVLQESMLKGIDFLLNMQYETGGWPQVYPLNNSYADYVTYNDGAMMRVMITLKLVAEQQFPFDHDGIDAERVARAAKAIELGLDYILKSQIEVDGYPTAWGQQHDPYTYEPREGRAYEHPSLSGAESVGIVNYLLQIPDPSDEVKKAIVGALRWFDWVKLDGVKYVAGDPQGAYFYRDGESVTWFRFYEIGTNHPIFSGRNGLIKHNIHQIEQERADGYRWAGEWAKDLLPYIETLDYFKEVSHQLDVERLQKERARKAAEQEAQQATAEVDEAVSGEEVAHADVTAAAPQQDAMFASDVEWESRAEQSQSRGLIVLMVGGAGLLALVAFMLGRRLGKRQVG